MSKTTKDIVISSLGMRFYIADGWTDELVRSYLIAGTIIAKGGSGEFDYDYLVLEPGSKLDIDRMVEDGIVGTLIGRNAYGELKGLTDLEVLRERSW